MRFILEIQPKDVMPPEIYSSSETSEYAKKEARLDEYDSSTLYPPFPQAALIEVTNACNHACVFCANPRMQRTKGVIDFAVYETFVRDAVALGLKDLGLYATGEPLLVKNLERYVASAKQLGVNYVFMTSNGALATPARVTPLIEAGLDSIKFSINAGDARTYALIHGSDDFQIVLDNLRALADYRRANGSALRMIASCILTRATDPDKERIRDLLSPLVDDLVFFGVDAQSGQSLAQFDQIRSAASPDFPPQGQAPPCAMLWNRVHVTWEGYLSLCCVDYENLLTYADLNAGEPLASLWRNAAIVEMRRRHQVQELGHTLCQNCLYGTQAPVEPLTSHRRPVTRAGRTSSAAAIAERVAQIRKNGSS